MKETKMEFPKCILDTPEQCRFEIGVVSVTSTYYPPVYDRDGVNCNPDKNIKTGLVTCLTCGNSWSYRNRVCEELKEEDYQILETTLTPYYET